MSTEEIVHEIAHGFYRSVLQIAHAAAQILAHGSPRGAYKAAAGLLKLNGLLIHDIIVERTERQLVGASFYVMNEWDFVLFKIEEGDEHASFQLGDALDAELGKPLLLVSRNLPCRLGFLGSLPTG